MPKSPADPGGTAKKPAAKKTSAKAPVKRARKASADELRLTGDRLVVRSPENGERKSSGGLLIPATAQPAPKKLAWADVQIVGPDVRVAKRGDRVLFLPQAGLEVELDGEDMVLLRERDVQAVRSVADDRHHSQGQYL
jgi:chaperonin GroES